MRRGVKLMKVVIEQTKYCYDDEQIFKDYPILEKYRTMMDYYTGYDDGTNSNYWQYSRDNAIVIELTNNELVKLLQEPTNESQLVIGWASKYDHETYGIDFVVEIYDDYRE